MWLLLALLLSNAAYSLAASQQDLLSEFVVSPGEYTSVAENAANMDTDHNGFADVAEVRAYLALKHGADYQKAILDRWEIAATSKSCGLTNSTASKDAGGLTKALFNN